MLTVKATVLAPVLDIRFWTKVRKNFFFFSKRIDCVRKTFVKCEWCHPRRWFFFKRGKKKIGEGREYPVCESMAVIKLKSLVQNILFIYFYYFFLISEDPKLFANISHLTSNYDQLAFFVHKWAVGPFPIGSVLLCFGRGGGRRHGFLYWNIRLFICRSAPSVVVLCVYSLFFSQQKFSRVTHEGRECPVPFFLVVIVTCSRCHWNAVA